MARCSAASASASAFTRESVLPVWGKRAQSLMPGQLIAIYGRGLAVPGGCTQPPPTNGVPYPTEMCGTQVTVGGIPAGLLAVLENQINCQVPAGAPASGEAAIVVSVRGVSSQPVVVPFGKPKVILSLEGPAYVHMPVWIAFERPYPYDISYPYALSPWNFGGGAFEVRRNGALLQPLEYHRHEAQMNGPGNGSVAPEGSTHARLPLHLQYRFDLPGKYEVRFAGSRMDVAPGAGFRTVVVDESDWTEIEVLPYSDEARRRWIQVRAWQMPASPGLLVSDAIPGLLAVPDELVLPAILAELYHSNEVVRRYAAGSLTMFATAVLRRELTRLVLAKGPTEEIARILDGREELFESGHDAILRTLPQFLNSGPPLVQAGGLQYLAWGQNHDWGKTPEFRRQLSAMLPQAARNVLEHGDARSQQTLALALGALKTDVSRGLLWRMIESGMGGEQSRIALAWIGDLRDLPRLAGLLTRADTADPYGYGNSSLPYGLHRAYGDASLPYLERAARETKQIWVRTACAKELVLANRAEGFQYLLQAMEEMPSFRLEAVQFMRDRFVEVRSVSEEAVVASIRARAGAR